MGGKKRGRERSNSKLSISSDTGPWGSASAAASASAVDMANWGSNPEDIVVPPPSNPTPPSGGLAAFWGLGKSSSSPPVKKEKKSKSTSMPAPVVPAGPSAAGWDIPKPEGTPSMPETGASNGVPAGLARETKPSSKASTAKPTPASTPPTTTPAPIAKLSKKANKRVAQSAAAAAGTTSAPATSASAPAPTLISEEDLPPKAAEEDEWTPGSSSISPPVKGTSSFWNAGKEEKKKKRAERAETRAPLPPTMPPSASATHASLVAAMTETWNEESEEPAADMSHQAGTEHGFGFALDPTMASAFNATAWPAAFSVPAPELEPPQTAAPPISISQLASASSSSKATLARSGKSTPTPPMSAGKADQRMPVPNQPLGRPLVSEENPDASDWLAFTNRSKNAGPRPSKLGSTVISAHQEEKQATPVDGGKTGTPSGWAVKQEPPKQDSPMWRAFGASPTDPALQAKPKARAPQPTKKPAQGGSGPHFGGWGSINTPVQPTTENSWDTWSARSVPSIEIVGTSGGSLASKEDLPLPLPSTTSPAMSTWKPAGSTSGGSSNRTSGITVMDATHTARSSWMSLLKEPHGFNAAQWKANGSGSTLGPVSEGQGENGAANDVWDMDMGGSGPPSDASVPWPGELSPELLRSLQGPPEYSSGSDKESRKRQSEIGSGLRRPESGFKSAFANLSDSGEEKGKASLVPNKNPLNNVSDSSSSRSSRSAFPQKPSSSPSGFGLSKSPPAAPAVIASTAKGKTAASAAVRPTTRMPGGFLSWDEDGESKDVDLDQLMAMVDEPNTSARPAAPSKPPGVSIPAPTKAAPVAHPTLAAKGKKGRKGKGRANSGFDEEELEPYAPTMPASSAVDDDLLAQADWSLRPQARPQVNPPLSPYKTRTRTVWIEDEVPTRIGSLEASSVPNPLEEMERLEKAKKLEEEERLERARKLEEEEKEKEKEKEEATKAGGGNKKGNNNNNNNNNNSNKKGKKKR
jgi:hypothetical protein